MGRQHIRDGILSIRQQKTGALVEIPILSELQEALEAMAADNLTFLTTEYGKPFTAAGFGNWFRQQCNAAGLPIGYSAHGLRKAAATRLADAGCTDHEIMAWGGWETLKEVQRYTKAANRKRLAQSGREKLETRTRAGKPE
jgi:integrase